MIVVVYVDDVLAFAMSDKDSVQFQSVMESEYEIINFDDITYFLGPELQWSPTGDEVCISQHKYISTF
ncbi:Reverse transcriptase (RNA-dependent DNA polymerase) [Phytophthora infestans]|uniref:Reverse transcriptase (RNA-dependent DNA polymerase) n=1 Tax=Phytophthora infestans TaxID=4787 RepID=A0A833WL48_PHYIN|nr:Reverse transcriptase (RNA-dependent DNA polymerase) [Phytophthora infestans]KAF4138888.1 Reverse transcriptase (RNA-dependent DNA polymerase) [Phytophthora infestans]